jgi:hypothetical protein
MLSGFGTPGILEIRGPAMPEIHEQESENRIMQLLGCVSS